MNNNSTGYNISQTGDLYTLQSSSVSAGTLPYNSTRGTTVNAPLNYRKQMAFKGLDNEFFFFIKNQDRKPIMLNGLTINASVVNRENSTTIVRKSCQILDEEIGHCKLVITSGELSSADSGLYDLILTYTNNQGLVLPLYTDMNMRPNFALEVSDQAHTIPLTSETADAWLAQSGYYYSGKLYGPSYYKKPNGLITIAVYATGYTGKFYVQGATSDYPDETDWFDVELGVATAFHQYISFTGVDPFSWKSNLKYIRIKWEATGTGTVDKVVTRL